MIDRIQRWHELVKPDRDPKLAFELVVEEFHELKTTFLSGDGSLENAQHICKEAADLIWVAARMIYDQGFDVEKVMTTVAYSNESKLIPTEHAHDNDVKHYLTENPGTDTHRLSLDMWGILNDSGKLMKGPFYEPANLEGCESK